MGIEDLARKYGNDETALAILGALRRVHPEYLWGRAVYCVASYYVYPQINSYVVGNYLAFLERDGLVESKPELDWDEMMEIRNRLIEERKISEEALRLHRESFPEPLPGYKLTKKGLYMPIYRATPEKTPMRRLVPDRAYVPA